MATATASAATLPGVSASIWADKPMPPRGGWGKGSESGSGLRGAPRGGSRGRGRGGRGGRGGSGGRSSQTKAPAATPETDIKQTDGAQKDQAPSTFQKSTTPQSPTTTTSFQTNGSTKGPNKVKPPRKNSDQRPPRKQPPLGVDTLNVTPSNASSSPSVSPRTPNRRRRSNAQKSAPPPPPPVPTNHARKQSIASEQDPTHVVEKPAPAPPPARELPPHMAPAQPNHAPSDIAHNIDALVERVRAVAMDRPTTPGNHSHFDWAEDDEDDSLPDLDDWGVTSSLSTTGPITDVADGEKIGVSVISPILQDTLRPLPNIVDIDISTPSIKLHDVNGVEANLKNKADQNTSHLGSAPSEAKVEAPTQEAVSSDKGAPKTQNSESSITERSKSPSPPRGLTSSIHASHHAQSSLSPPPHRLPNPPRGGFNPSHNRAHTVGEQTKEVPTSDRTRRNDRFSHGRNHSTPHTGPGTATAHARAIHHTRPVISGDAISRLARSLGGAVPKREREAAATANA